MGPALSSAITTEALSNAPLGLLILDRNGHIAWLNPTMEKLLDISGERLIGQNEGGTEPSLRNLLFSPDETQFLEATATRPARWLQAWRATPREAGGAIHYYADITELQNAVEDRDRLHEELAQHATRDSVTGLPNRQALLQGLEPLVSRSRRYHNPLSVIRLRIDNLGEADAEFGEGSGDAAMVAVAQMLKDQMRWADLIGRFDKDEFLLVLPETALDAATHLLDKLRHRLGTLIPMSSDGKPISLAAQFGAAGWQDGDDRAKLLRRAREQLEQGT